MNSYSIVQFVTLIIYLILILSLVRHIRKRLKNLFIIYLVASMAWSLSSFLAHADIPDEYSFWSARFIAFAASWSIVAYAHFIAAYLHNHSRAIGISGYGYLAIIAVLVLLGHIPSRVYSAGNGVIVIDYGAWIHLMTAGGAVFIVTAVVMMVRSYIASRSSEYRNRIAYLLAGVGFIVLFGIWFETLPMPRYPLDHIGHLGNAFILTYAIVRYQLFDIKFVIRKGLVYSGITICITAGYLIIMAMLQHLFHDWINLASVGAMVITAILMAWLFNPVRVALQKVADRLFYGKRYDYRQTVLTLSHQMSGVLDMDELAEAMLRPITKAVHASQASLLLPSNGHFASSFAERLTAEEPVTSFKIAKDSPLITWLGREARPLLRETIDLNQEFKALWEAERKVIESADIELLCPIKSKDDLVGILALSKKQPHGFYSNDDIDLLMTVAHEAAVAIENAQLYARAKERANIDELTGLFNHRYFHQRIDEEIARCSRFGHIFSLLFLDLDLFKMYNDIHGHLAGDEILKQVAQNISSTIRRVDIGVRYGGDEFAVILPQTSPDFAHKVAEKIHNRVEAQMGSMGVPITCSIGVASWPTDGVGREDIIQAADTALYYAKQTGRNQICKASDVLLSTVLTMQGESKNRPAVLNTIYALAATVDAKDHYTYGHSKKVSKYATEIARVLGYSQKRISTIRAAALLHDIGKIGIPDRLLEKVGPLSAEDWEPMRNHPTRGVSILKHIEELKDCLPGVQYHHEHYDGSGYPAGLRGDNIPLDARILAVADAYDAMTSARPYRKETLNHDEAIEELKRCAETQFDPKIVRVFIACIDGGQTVGRASGKGKPVASLEASKKAGP